jgi:hypothetical protein
MVVGGGVCHIHGGAASQVRAKREQRVLVAEARAAVDPVVVVQREPEEVLLDALHDTNVTLQAIKAELHGGSVNPILLQVAGDWLDRVARISKIIVDGAVAERLERRVGWIAQDRAATCWAMLAAIVEASPLTAAQKLTLWQSRFDGLRAVDDGRAPARLSGDALHRFSDSLVEAAAAERAVAEGVRWGDSSESDSDIGEPDSEHSDSVSGELVLFPSYATTTGTTGSTTAW